MKIDLTLNKMTWCVQYLTLHVKISFMTLMAYYKRLCYRGSGFRLARASGDVYLVIFDIITLIMSNNNNSYAKLLHTLGI